MQRDAAAALLANLVMIALPIAVLLAFGRRHGVAIAALTAFAARVLRGWQVQVNGDFSDGIQYDSFAVTLARYWADAGPDPGAWVGKDGFPAILAGVYSVVGHAPEIGYLLNAFAGGLSVLVIAAATAQMGWGRAVRPAAWIVALWPAGIAYGGMLLREASVSLLLAVGLWGAVRLYKMKVGSGIAAIAAAGLAMVFMRGALAFLVLIGMPLAAVLASTLRGKVSAPRMAVGAAVTGFAVIALGRLSDYFADSRLFQYRPEVTLAQNVGASSFGEAGVGTAALDQSVGGHLARIPLTALGPLPWQVTNVQLAQAAVDAALWVLVWAAAIYGIASLARKAEALLFVLPQVALIVALSTSASNFGLIIRLRGQGIVLVAPLAAIGIVHLIDRHRARRAAREGGGGAGGPTAIGQHPRGIRT
ncbi:MAG: hypothetical protein ACYC3K_00180 [Candidatus Nanopelagicales bacterium]